MFGAITAAEEMGEAERGLALHPLLNSICIVDWLRQCQGCTCAQVESRVRALQKWAVKRHPYLYRRTVNRYRHRSQYCSVGLLPWFDATCLRVVDH